MWVQSRAVLPQRFIPIEPPYSLLPENFGILFHFPERQNTLHFTIIFFSQINTYSTESHMPEYSTLFFIFEGSNIFFHKLLYQVQLGTWTFVWFH